jgi:hypothetical protein
MVGMRPKRPIGIIFVEIIILSSGLWNGLRVGNVIFFGKILEKYSAHPWYLAISGGFWLISAVILSIGIWRKKTWAWAGIIAGLIAYCAWYWIDRLIIQVPHSNWPFAVLYTFLLLAISTITLFRTKTRIYFNLVGY